jgi:hypothetical protein
VAELPELIDFTFPSYTPPPPPPRNFEPIISLNALTGFSTPQTLKIIGYIKYRKVIILIENGNTHNFIHRHIAQETNYYICTVNKVQIKISNGGFMKCGECCENVLSTWVVVTLCLVQNGYVLLAPSSWILRN